MLRGIFLPAGVTPEQVAYYVELFRKVRATPDWKEFMEKGAFNDTFMSGAGLRQVGRKNEAAAPTLMKEAGFLVAK